MSGQPKQSVLYQLSTVGALSERVYDTDTSCAELATRGDFGLGAFNHLDGEMIVLDGKFYQVAKDGSAYLAAETSKAAFATLTFFEPHITMQIAAPVDDFSQLKSTIDRVVRSRNMFYAIRIKGQFKAVSMRSVVCQHAPYMALTEVAKHQAEFDFTNINGTMVGFRAPQFAAELTVGGYHLHFVDYDCSHGGHVIEATLERGTIEIQEIARLQVELPDTAEYLQARIGNDYDKAFQSIETARAADQ